MANRRTPFPSGDIGVWGNILNDYLRQISDVSAGITDANFTGGLNNWTTAGRPTQLWAYTKTGGAGNETLGADHVGLTGINTTTGQIERWSGSAWTVLTYPNMVNSSGNISITATTASTSTTTGSLVVSGGLGVGGDVFATSFSGSGASLTALNATNLASGTVPIARIPTGTLVTQVALGNHTHSFLPLTGGTLTGALVLTAGTTTIQPLRLQTGVKLTTPVFGSVEFDGTNLYLTNNSTTPTRKTIAYIDSNITGSASRITTARNIAITGDATWNVNFDGSANATAALTLASSGVKRPASKN